MPDIEDLPVNMSVPGLDDLPSTMSEEQISGFIKDIPDEVLGRMTFTLPWNAQLSGVDYGRKDEDGFRVLLGGDKDYPGYNFQALQKECWIKFNSNPQINSSIRDYAGRVAGQGFEMGSFIPDVHAAMHEIIYDQRNRLYSNVSKWVARRGIEGELFLIFTVHKSGFIEVDFRDPATVAGVGQDNCGILYHPFKTQMPLMYQFTLRTYGNRMIKEQIPSINIARYPELMKVLPTLKGYQPFLTENHVDKSPIFKNLSYFYRFVLQWDTAYLTKRNLSWLRCIIEWCNYYEMLKKYEIDHKRSSGAYLWVIEIENAHAFRNWLGLSEDQKNQTGILAKPVPGGKIILPPGMKMTVQNPNLPKISDSDTDIMHMITAGLNMPEDMITGQSGGTFASVSASRPPQADRISDEIAYFDRFLKHDFWSGAFFLKNAVDPSFKLQYPMMKAVGFKGKGENIKPIMKEVMVDAEHCVEISYPISELSGLSDKTAALLGVKHGSVNATLGIPNEAVAKRLGITNYQSMRLRAATEDETLPKLQPEVDQSGPMQEAQQEGNKGSGEVKQGANKPIPKVTMPVVKPAVPAPAKPVPRKRTS